MFQTRTPAEICHAGFCEAVKAGAPADVAQRLADAADFYTRHAGEVFAESKEPPQFVVAEIEDENE